MERQTQKRASSYSFSTPLFRARATARGESGTEKRRRRLNLPIPRQIGTYQLVGHTGWNKTRWKRRGAALFDTRIHPLCGEGVCAAAVSYVRGWHYIAEQSIHAVSTTNSLLHELSQPTLSIFRPQTISSSAVSRPTWFNGRWWFSDHICRFSNFPESNLTDESKFAFHFLIFWILFELIYQDTCNVYNDLRINLLQRFSNFFFKTLWLTDGCNIYIFCYKF